MCAFTKNSDNCVNANESRTPSRIRAAFLRPIQRCQSVRGHDADQLAGVLRISRVPGPLKAIREHTPPELAKWLAELAASCKGHNAE